MKSINVTFAIEPIELGMVNGHMENTQHVAAVSTTRIATLIADGDYTITISDVSHDRTGDEADVVDMTIWITAGGHEVSGRICVVPDRINGGHALMAGGLDVWLGSHSSLYRALASLSNRTEIVREIADQASRAADAAGE